MRRLILIVVLSLLAIYPAEMGLRAEGIMSGTIVLSRDAPQVNVWTAYELETTQNTLNLAQFPDAKLPPGHFSILGYGFPSFLNEPRGPVLKALTVGHTHLCNSSAFPDENVRPDAHYHFELVPALASDAADKLIREGRYRPEYGDYSGIVQRQQRFEGITREGALELGKQMFYLRSQSWSPNQQSWTRFTDNGSWIMMDEEEDLWKSDQASLFASWLLEGHASAAPHKKIGFYGHPVTWRLHTSYQDMTDNEIDTFLRDETTAFDSESWKKAAPYIDLSLGYFRVPYLENSSLYKKDLAGEFLIDEKGNRIWRDDHFTEQIFGHTNHIWAEPEPDLRNLQRDDQGGVRVHTELAEGWRWDSWCGHERNDLWQPEVKMMVEGIYRYADCILISKLLLCKADFGDMDISYWRDARLKTYVERRPRTEPWTWGGNTRWIRETGASALKYQVMFAFLSGVQAVSTWDNGGIIRNETQLTPYGQSVFGQGEFSTDVDPNDPGPHPDNYSRYVVWTAAVNTFARLMQDVPIDQSLRYIRFYYPIAGSRNKEIISAGIYSGNKFIVMFTYPLLDPDEQIILRITAGSMQYEATLKGREVLLMELHVPGGLIPDQFTLQYTNIDGNKIHVNGLISDTVADHYVR